jgi:hypothetical protein
VSRWRSSSRRPSLDGADRETVKCEQRGAPENGPSSLGSVNAPPGSGFPATPYDRERSCPLDFLRRLAALVSFPYSHQVRYHGLFSNHCKFRRLLPPPPPRPGTEEAQATLPLPSGEPAAPPEAQATQGPLSGKSRKRTPWAQLLLRVFHLDSLACPRCSRPGRPLPMVVLAFLTDPEVVVKILQHLGMPTAAPALTRSSSSGRGLGFALVERGAACSGGLGDEAEGSITLTPPIRPPP